jgi:hypothetical protein
MRCCRRTASNVDIWVVVLKKSSVMGETLVLFEWKQKFVEK